MNHAFDYGENAIFSLTGGGCGYIVYRGVKIVCRLVCATGGQVGQGQLGCQKRRTCRRALSARLITWNRRLDHEAIRT